MKTEAFAYAGATVIMVDIQKPDEQVRKLVDAGYKAVAYTCDVSDVQAVKEMIEWIVSTYGRLDAALNNAGIQTPQRPMASPRRLYQVYFSCFPSEKAFPTFSPTLR